MLCCQTAAHADSLFTEVVADLVHGVDQVVAFCGLLLVGGEEFELGGGEREAVADQAEMPDADAAGPGQLEGAPGQFEKSKIVGCGRFGGQLAGAALAVRIIQEDGDPAGGPPAPAQLAAGLFDQGIQGALQGGPVIGVVAEFVISHDSGRLFPGRQNR